MERKLVYLAALVLLAGALSSACTGVIPISGNPKSFWAPRPRLPRPRHPDRLIGRCRAGSCHAERA